MTPVLLGLLLFAQNPKLEAGIELYEAGALNKSLAALLDALDAKSVKERAKARLYIGLIQHRTGNRADAESSFKRALELSKTIRPPRNTPAATQAAFERIREEVGPKKVVPKKVPKKRPRKTGATPTAKSGGPEMLAPVKQTESTGSWSVERRNQGDRPLTKQVETTSPEPETMPTIGWVFVAAGAAAGLVGGGLLISSRIQSGRAFDNPEKARAAELHESAGTQQKAGVGVLVGAGVMFGVAAVTIAF